MFSHFPYKASQITYIFKKALPSYSFKNPLQCNSTKKLQLKAFKKQFISIVYFNDLLKQQLMSFSMLPVYTNAFPRKICYKLYKNSLNINCVVRRRTFFKKNSKAQQF